jgi:hypothetical protein
MHSHQLHRIFINLSLLPNNIYNFVKIINIFKQLYFQIALPCA